MLGVNRLFPQPEMCSSLLILDHNKKRAFVYSRNVWFVIFNNIDDMWYICVYSHI